MIRRDVRISDFQVLQRTIKKVDGQISSRPQCERCLFYGKPRAAEYTCSSCGYHVCSTCKLHMTSAEITRLAVWVAKMPPGPQPPVPANHQHDWERI